MSWRRRSALALAVLGGSVVLTSCAQPDFQYAAEKPGDAPAGTVFFTHGRIYHAAMPNTSDAARHVLIYSYGHTWMKPWQGYEPSAKLQSRANTNVLRQLFHVGDPYRYKYDLDDDVAPRMTLEQEYAQRYKQKPGRGLT